MYGRDNVSRVGKAMGGEYRCMEDWNSIDVLRIMVKEEELSRLRKVETPRSFQHGHPQFLFHNLPARVIGELQVVDASHDARKVVVSSQR